MTAREVRWGRGALQTGRVGAALLPAQALGPVSGEGKAELVSQRHRLCPRL